MKKRYIWLSVAFISTLIVISFGVLNKSKTQFLEIKKGDVLEAIYGLGKVKSDNVFEVKIGIMTNIKNIYVKEGEKVDKGNKVIQFEGGLLFYAPINGTITSVIFQKGEIALPQVPIIRIEDLDNKFIEVSLEQQAALRVKKDQSAKVIFESLKANELEGTVISIYPKNGEFIARIEVNKLDSNILPGMTADVVIKVGSKKDAILIPVKAIVEGKVIRYRNEKKEKIDVQIGHSDGLWAELKEGDLMLGDQLMIKGK